VALRLVTALQQDGGTTTTTAPDDGGQGIVPDVTDLEQACGEGDSWFCEQVFDWTGSRRWAGAAEWFVTKPAQILLIVVVALVASRVLRWLVKRTVERTMLDPAGRSRLARLRERTPDVLLRTGATNLRAEARAQALITVFRGLASAAVWFVAFVAVLGVLEINLGPLLAGAGIAGVALGFGAQNLVRDFLSGTFIILEDQYGVGDIVDLGEAVGTVEKITLRVTRLRDVNGVVWHVPNGEILRVANKSQDWARAVLDVDVAYSTDLAQARDVIERTAQVMSADSEWQPRILDAPEVWGVEAFGPVGVTMRVVVKTQAGIQADVLRELRRRVKEAFDEAGIEIPSQYLGVASQAPGPAMGGTPADGLDEDPGT
jgi:small conductance mechanosensitive channel